MFIYENNKSMSKEIRASITETFGFEPICINSALVSAQNRQRLYWVGVRNEDGTYRKASIEQPADRGILLKDVLDSAQPCAMDNGKGYALTASYGKANAADLHRGRNSQAAEPVGIKPLGGLNNSHQRRVVYDATGKTPTLVAGMGAGGGNTPLVSEPVCVASRGRNPENPSSRIAGDPTEQRLEAHEDGKTNTLTSVSKDNLIAEPACGRYERSDEATAADLHPDLGRYTFISGETTEQARVDFLGGFTSDENAGVRLQDGKAYSRNFRQGVRLHGTDAKSVTVTAQGAGLVGHAGLYAVSQEPEVPLHDKMYTLDAQYGKTPGVYNPHSQHSYSRHAVAVPQEPQRIGTMPSAEGRQGGGQAMRIYDPDGKSTTLKANAGGGGGKTGLYATQEKPAKQQRVYTVQDGQIEVNGKRYPIKLKDGQYIIRKLTVSECMRLQTVPEWYDFSCVSNTQAYKMLGNGWTCEVIAHLIRGAMKSSIFGV